MNLCRGANHCIKKYRFTAVKKNTDFYTDIQNLRCITAGFIPANIATIKKGRYRPTTVHILVGGSKTQCIVF